MLDYNMISNSHELTSKGNLKLWRLERGRCSYPPIANAIDFTSGLIMFGEPVLGLKKTRTGTTQTRQ